MQDIRVSSATLAVRPLVIAVIAKYPELIFLKVTSYHGLYCYSEYSDIKEAESQNRRHANDTKMVRIEMFHEN